LYLDEAIGCSWYNISPTIHKIVVHGAAINDAIDLPLGLLSEEPSECNNKEIRKAKNQHSRRNDPINTMMDTYNRGMDRSDPVIISWLSEEKLANRPKRPKLSLEVADLLKEDVFFSDVETDTDTEVMDTEVMEDEVTENFIESSDSDSSESDSESSESDSASSESENDTL
jgi:hypothetical protein